MSNLYGKNDLTPLSDEQLERASRKQLIALLRGEQQLRQIFQEVAEESEARRRETEERVSLIEGLYYKIRVILFRPKTERRKLSRHKLKGSASSDAKAKATKLPSERYPNAEVIDKHITAQETPVCKSCGGAMEDSGLTETSEYLTVVPREFIVVRQHRHTYRCRCCHGDLRTVPALPRVIPGGSYSDEMAVDVAISKYCDLIPIERYSQMAKRQGFEGIPPQSLIGLTQKLATFFRSVYERLRSETLRTEVLLADETPHRMLEGDEKEGWFLWGFSSPIACFYECHPTRSGDVAGAVLEVSPCEVLVSDVYSGYGRAVREVNEKRLAEGKSLIQMAFCNAHARRNFIGIAEEDTDDALFMVESYGAIYALEAEHKKASDTERKAAREDMLPYFEAMKSHAESRVHHYSTKSGIAKGFYYFLKNYEGLTRCLSDLRIPLDNNASERLLRSPVVGRKTWYGTHSRAGAETAAIHFSLIEACKLNHLNPRAYYLELIDDLHAGGDGFTPHEWRQRHKPQVETS